jgi:cellulose synthase/poly-beta-1,6-N-acetylglucosamine synthase-like glycosyltransferase
MPPSLNNRRAAREGGGRRVSVPSVLYWALVVANLFVMPFFLFLLVTSLAALVAGRDKLSRTAPSSRILVVIPAHNEETGIAATVESCLASDYPSLLYGVLVIADNCTDRTAALAAGAGARVVERVDSAKKSKGYAIEFLIDSLARSGELASLDALVFFDADTTIDRTLLRCFDERLRAERDWIQCYYTVANPDESWRTRLLTYAFALYNGVLLLGAETLGASAGFKGNGMCFSTRGLRRRPWKCYGLVEDMEYSWTLRVAGEKIAFERRACVYGAMVGSDGAAAASQRQRWESGRSQITRKYLWPLIASNELGGWDKLMAVCELLLPPMAYLAIIYGSIVALDAVAISWLGASGSRVSIPFLVACSLVMTAALFYYAVSPFLALGLPWRYARSVALFPFYMAWKLIIARGGPPQEWVRTARPPRA